MSLKSTYAGIELKNPIIAASSNKTNSAAKNLALESAGVGAIILKSLFEENILNQCAKMSEYADSHAEGADYMQEYMRSSELSDYINLIKESKAKCSIPIVASINAVSSGEWVEFAKLIEDAGADALELNIMGIECDVNYEDGEFEKRHLEIAQAVLAVVSIPVVIKLGAFLTSPISLVSKLKACGVKGVVMFNRMYQADIDINEMQYVPAHTFSSAQELALPLRWVAIASARVKGLDFVLSGGVKSGEDVVKAILAGASSVEVCSVMFTDGNDWVEGALHQVEQWQEDQGFGEVLDYKGRMNASGGREQEMLVRTQFLRHFGSVE